MKNVLLWLFLNCNKCSWLSSGACDTIYSWWNSIETWDSGFVLITWSTLIFFHKVNFSRCLSFPQFLCQAELRTRDLSIFSYFCCCRADFFFLPLCQSPVQFMTELLNRHNKDSHLEANDVFHQTFTLIKVFQNLPNIYWPQKAVSIST